MRKLGLPQSTRLRQFGKFGRSNEYEDNKKPEMERSRKKKTLPGRVLGERLQHAFYHDSALALDITVEVQLEIEI